MQQHLKEIRDQLRPYKDKKGDEDYKAFRAKTTKLENWGIRLPELHQVARQQFSWLDKTDAEILKIWDYIWKNAKVHEAMSIPLFYYVDHRAELDLKEWKVLKTWINRIENWEHSDFLSSLYSVLLERHPEIVYPQLQKWNSSKYSWERRNSIVPLIYYASPRRTPPPANKILPLIKNLLHDQDPYVQKGVGWTLRECGKIYPAQTWKFLVRHICDLAPVSFSYATEKITKPQKQKLKKLREKRKCKKAMSS
ncbi:DNA alkylation repair protein [Patescibacteria group bacterium]